MPLIIDGELDENTLKELNKTKSWLNKELDKQHVILEDIFYCFYKNDWKNPEGGKKK